jgi:hypothetical protein
MPVVFARQRRPIVPSASAIAQHPIVARRVIITMKASTVSGLTWHIPQLPLSPATNR